MGFPLYVTCCFSLPAFNILSLCLVFVRRDEGAWWAAIHGVAQSWTWLKRLNSSSSLINMCLGVFLLGFILYGTICASWTWLTISSSILGKFSTIISSKIFSYPFFFSSSVATPIIGVFDIVWYCPRGFWDCPQFFSFFFNVFCSSEVISTILSSSSLIQSSALDILLLIPSRVFLTSIIALFVFACLFFNSFRFLSILAFSPFCFQGFWSTLLSVFWILFHYFLFINLDFCVSICSFISVVFLCLFIIFVNLLCLRSPFPRLQVWILSSFWFLPS